MVLQSTRWLALGYFTYFLVTAFFYLSGASGLRGLLNARNHRPVIGGRSGCPFSREFAHRAPRQHPSRLISALRVLALLTLLFAVAFWAGAHVAWLMLVMIGFNLFFSPLVPLTDALANTWQKRVPA